MKEKLTLEDFRGMLQHALDQIKLREDEFSQLDAITGDGDHGQAIVRAMEVIVRIAHNGTEFKTLLNDIGFGVMMEVSGSTSTLLGAFFLGMSDAVSGTELDAAAVRAMFEGGLNGVQQQTNAKRGDKTMMDALIPAVEAIQAQDTTDIKELLNVCAQAALKGADETIGMKANFGRARNYGDKSIGYADCGASSWSCMFDAFAKSI